MARVTATRWLTRRISSRRRRLLSARPLTVPVRRTMMRADVTMLGVAALLLAAGTSPEMTPEQRREMLARTTGTIVGTIREAGTNQPLEGVSVSAQHLGDQTDANGRFRIYYIDPGEVEVTAWRRDLIETRGRVRVVAGRETPIELSIRRSPPSCCRLAGTWS